MPGPDRRAPPDRARESPPARAPGISLLARALRRALVPAGLGLAAAHPAAAQQLPSPAPGGGGATRVDSVIVTGVRADEYLIDESSLGKLTESLLDTPQSITAMSAAFIEDRAASSLDDALRAVPGITLGAGEFSWQGNNPTIRGFSARDDMYLDGIRDFGSYPRDPFNLESVEVLLGPASVLFGRGSTGGAINQATKRPRLEADHAVSLNLGSDDTVRAAFDMNRPLLNLGEGAALRLNLLAHEGDMTDRDGAHAERFGIAPSLALGLGSPTEIVLSYMKQSADDRPDYGLPWLLGRPAPVRRANFYGFESDYLETDADIATFAVVHSTGETIRLDVQARYADYERRTRITEPLITQLVTSSTPLEDIDVYRYVYLGESEETLGAVLATAALELDGRRFHHSLAAGAEFADESSSPSFAFGDGVPGTDLLNPTPGEPFLATSANPSVIADTSSRTLALFAIDTIDMGERWLVTAGARFDRFDTGYDATRYPIPPTPFYTGTQSGREQFAQTDDVVSLRTAVVYKPRNATSVYLAGSNSFNPSAQSLSYLTSGRALGTENVNLDPEENRSIEAGVKIGLHNEALLLSAALFETTKKNARVADPANPGFNMLEGEQRVRGFSVDATGTVASRVYLTAGYTWMDSEVVKAAAGGVTGMRLVNSPEHSVSVWTDYQIAARFDLGLGVRYVSEQLAQNTGAGRRVPEYTIYDAMVRYRASDAFTLKLNLANFTDELYFGQLHAWHVVPGAGFTTTFAISYEY
jgi:catecholate siderophore receptor